MKLGDVCLYIHPLLSTIEWWTITMWCMCWHVPVPILAHLRCANLLVSRNGSVYKNLFDSRDGSVYKYTYDLTIHDTCFFSKLVYFCMYSYVVRRYLHSEIWHRNVIFVQVVISTGTCVYTCLCMYIAVLPDCLCQTDKPVSSDAKLQYRQTHTVGLSSLCSPLVGSTVHCTTTHTQPCQSHCGCGLQLASLRTGTLFSFLCQTVAGALWVRNVLI